MRSGRPPTYTDEERSTVIKAALSRTLGWACLRPVDPRSLGRLARHDLLRT